jgi:hypothetical protein
MREEGKPRVQGKVLFHVLLLFIQFMIGLLIRKAIGEFPE